MNRKHVRTLSAIVTDPVSATIAWADVEALFLAVNCRSIEGTGSRVKFECKGVVSAFHRPHPSKEAKRYQVRDAREFLSKIGVRP